MLRLVYLEMLFALWENGGELPADPEILSDELMLPPAEIKRSLEILQALGCREGSGGLTVANGIVSNARITADLAIEMERRAVNREAASIGGSRSAAKRSLNRSLDQPQAVASEISSGRLEKPKRALPKNTKQGSPTPTPTPTPLYEVPNGTSLASEDFGPEDPLGIEPPAPTPRKLPGNGLVADYAKAFRRRYAFDPAPSRTDIIAAATALKPFPPEERRAIVETYLEDEDPWICERSHALRHLPRNLDRVRGILRGTIKLPPEQAAAREKRLAHREVIAEWKRDHPNGERPRNWQPGDEDIPPAPPRSDS